MIACRNKSDRLAFEPFSRYGVTVTRHGDDFQVTDGLFTAIYPGDDMVPVVTSQGAAGNVNAVNIRGATRRPAEAQFVLSVYSMTDNSLAGQTRWQRIGGEHGLIKLTATLTGDTPWTESAFGGLEASATKGEGASQGRQVKEYLWAATSVPQRAMYCLRVQTAPEFPDRDVERLVGRFKVLGAPGVVAAPNSVHPAPVAAGQLEAALTAGHVAAADVVQRVVGKTSAWAVVVGRRDDAHAATEYRILRVLADAASELVIRPPIAHRPSVFRTVVSFEARDLDGDGSEDGVLVVEWTRELKKQFPETCRDCVQTTHETATQLYLLGGANDVQIGFTHLLSYRTTSDVAPDGAMPRPRDEQVKYQWLVIGTPKIVTISISPDRFAQINADRLPNALDPKIDPLLGESQSHLVTFPP